MSPLEIATSILLAAAILTQWICCLGLCVMRNAFDKLHAIAPAGILPPLLIAVALFLKTGWSLFAAKALFVAVVLIVAQAVIVHAIARAAHVHEK